MRDFILSSNPMAVYAVLDGSEPIESDMIAINSDSAALPAADTTGLTVAGVCTRVITDDEGNKSVEVRDGIFLFANSEDNPLTRANRGSLVYVEDKDTVSSSAGTNGIVAGVLVDIYDGFAYVDNRPASIAAASGKNPVAVVVAPTYVAPDGGTTVDTEGRAATAQNAVDIAAIITALQSAGMMAAE